VITFGPGASESHPWTLRKDTGVNSRWDIFIHRCICDYAYNIYMMCIINIHKICIICICMYVYVNIRLITVIFLYFSHALLAGYMYFTYTYRE
jgi:hypothetical protein